MTISNYIPISNNNLFQNSDNEYIIYFEYNNIIYVFRNNNSINNNNNRNENVRHDNSFSFSNTNVRSSTT